MVNVSDRCSCFMPLYIFRSELGHVTWPGDGGQWETLKKLVFSYGVHCPFASKVYIQVKPITHLESWRC